MRIKQLKPGFEELTPAKARIIAHLIGDGCVYRVKSNFYLKYSCNDKELLEQFFEDVNQIYGLQCKLLFERSGKTGKLLPYIYVRSKLAFEDLTKLTSYYSKEWKVPEIILQSPTEIKINFLRAFFDDEATVYLQSRKIMIRAYSINYGGLEQIQMMLSEIGIQGSIRSGFGMKRNVFGLEVKNPVKFHRDVGFSLTRKQKKLLNFLL